MEIFCRKPHARGSGSQSVVAQEVCALPPTRLCCSHCAWALSWHRHPCFLLGASLGSPELGAFPREATFLPIVGGRSRGLGGSPLRSAVGASQCWLRSGPDWCTGPIGHVSLAGSRRPGGGLVLGHGARRSVLTQTQEHTRTEGTSRTPAWCPHTVHVLLQAHFWGEWSHRWRLREAKSRVMPQRHREVQPRASQPDHRSPYFMNTTLGQILVIRGNFLWNRVAHSYKRQCRKNQMTSLLGGFSFFGEGMCGLLL